MYVNVGDAFQMQVIHTNVLIESYAVFQKTKREHKQVNSNNSGF